MIRLRGLPAVADVESAGLEVSIVAPACASTACSAPSHALPHRGEEERSADEEQPPATEVDEVLGGQRAAVALVDGSPRNRRAMATRSSRARGGSTATADARPAQAACRAERAGCRPPATARSSSRLCTSRSRFDVGVGDEHVHPVAAHHRSAPRAMSTKKELPRSARTRPIVVLLPAASERAASLRTKPSSAIAARTCRRVASAHLLGVVEGVRHGADARRRRGARHPPCSAATAGCPARAASMRYLRVPASDAVV